MTLPHERTYSIERTRNFLRDLLDPKKTPKVPKVIREKAYRCLRHFPWDLHINQAAKVAPDVFAPTRNIDEDFLVSRLPTPSFGEQFKAYQDLAYPDTGEPDLPFKDIDGEDFLESPEPNEKLKKLIKGDASK